jgi:hypothetical protein
MKPLPFLRSALPFLMAGLLWACESKDHKEVPETKPRVFEPAAKEESTDTMGSNNAADSKPLPPGPPKMPSETELKQITPSQEAKRALSNDAMKAYSMKPEEFSEYMKTKIPYYRGKGNLKAENDVVRIYISATQMQIESPKGSQTFPMQ